MEEKKCCLEKSGTGTVTWSQGCALRPPWARTRAPQFTAKPECEKCCQNSSAHRMETWNPVILKCFSLSQESVFFLSLVCTWRGCTHTHTNNKNFCSPPIPLMLGKSNACQPTEYLHASLIPFLMSDKIIFTLCLLLIFVDICLFLLATWEIKNENNLKCTLKVV